jgi:ABC-type multidrug transport system ATPase subunit
MYNGTLTKKLGADFRRALGFMPQQQGLYDTFTGRRFLGYMAALKQIPKKQIAPEIEKAAATTNLSGELDKRLGAYSGGMKQRILIAQAIIGDPKLLILDEPTAGLDPKERIRMRNLIADLSKGRIVIIATHVVSDIEWVADEIILLKSGETVAKAAGGELIKQYAPDKGIEDVYMKFFAEAETAEETVC